MGEEEGCPIWIALAYVGVVYSLVVLSITFIASYYVAVNCGKHPLAVKWWTKSYKKIFQEMRTLNSYKSPTANSPTAHTEQEPAMKKLDTSIQKEIPSNNKVRQKASGPEKKPSKVKNQ
ncbi:unnamed protein product [Bursaphelenchus xylophilus]|uniref:(pine wood nematode) hypothetical protein n=1 Tax=Bursaphelenchus xylophilus TaxID=6326 RepID=A0A1I7S5X3_BURXY|nr:unnamed protein product [Bursaphelenchus xylophilus]CAG9082578.1 unnamed protein product [Bursaphelenchus xylophilus]